MIPYQSPDPSRSYLNTSGQGDVDEDESMYCGCDCGGGNCGGGCVLVPRDC